MEMDSLVTEHMEKAREVRSPERSRGVGMEGRELQIPIHSSDSTLTSA